MAFKNVNSLTFAVKLLRLAQHIQLLSLAIDLANLIVGRELNTIEIAAIHALFPLDSLVFDFPNSCLKFC